MGRRDDRPHFDSELGIPYDEYQFACWIACEGAIDQLAEALSAGRRRSTRVWRPRIFSRIADDEQVTEMALRFARPASGILRAGPRRR